MTHTLEHKTSKSIGVWFSIKCKRNKDWEVLEFLKSISEIIDSKIIEIPQIDSKKSKKNQWPGTIFVKTKTIKGTINAETRNKFLKIPNFIKFNSYQKGYNVDPIFISDKQFKKMLESVESKNVLSIGKFKPEDIDFEINDLVVITHGVFRGYEGEVIEINYDIGKITVNIEFFGRMTPTKVGFMECKRK